MQLENEREPINPTNFDEANQAVNEMFAAQMQQEQQPEAVPPVPETQPQGDMPPETVPAVPPEQTPPQSQQPSPEMILQQAFAENQALKQQLQQMQQTMAQMSDAQKQNIVEEALAMPELDLSTIAFDDEATLQAKQADYAAKMAEYTRSNIMKELSPVLQYAKDGMAQKEKTEVLAALSALPELQGFSDMTPQLEHIIANNKMLSLPDIPLDEKYITAYLIANGLNSRNKQPEEMTPEKFMQLYNSNPQFRDLVDKQRVQELKGSQDVPQMSASSGAVNAALNMPVKPKNFEEASELVRNMLN